MLGHLRMKQHHVFILSFFLMLIRHLRRVADDHVIWSEVELIFEIQSKRGILSLQFGKFESVSSLEGAATTGRQHLDVKIRRVGLIDSC